jgi:hypothetical protein
LLVSRNRRYLVLMRLALAFSEVAMAAVVIVLALPSVGRSQPIAYRCPVTFYLEDNRNPPVGIAHLVFDVVYTPPELRFVGMGTSVLCTRLVPNTLAIFDDDDHGALRVDLSTDAAISSFFQPLAVCTTESAELPKAADLAVTLVEETKVGGGAVVPPVAVRVLLPTIEDCGDVFTTTTSTTVPTTSSTTTTVPPPGPDCGDPTGDAAITATDALFTLTAAVGLRACDPCLCDVDGSSTVSASDALVMLQLAVGQPYELACPPC